MLKAVVFDYYETIAELSEETRERAFDDLARDLGVQLAAGEAFRQWRELTTRDWDIRLGGQQRPPLDGTPMPFVSFRDVWAQRSAELFRHWGVDTPGEAGAEMYERVHGRALAFPDVAPALEALHGRYALAVLSDADDGFLVASLRRNSLSFELVVSSEKLRAYKPHESLFRETCARLGVAPGEALYIGDSPWADIAGARHAGLSAAWLNRRGRGWPDDIETPETVVTSLSELAALLSG